MKVSLDIDSDYEETRVTIQCKEVDDSIKDILDFLKGREIEFIVGKNGEMQHILKPAVIHCFYASKDEVFAVTDDGEFKVREKLYELEQLLSPKQFVRLSKSVIANLHELSRFEASFNGTLCVHFKSGKKEYVTRHYVSSIKAALKINRRKSL
ncbi:LytTR family DNA-binding domain-containing protein [Pseudobacillus badius]|uniref:LytTR family DNA-binding domain-containing protein n=1 Tax=Bacillus badius TaxID=1455 RepID=UPI0007B0A93E|nr:LytTR family DNA-binding domain-containing protein [Bacillus badius]KZO00341.1 histidine kinase [Bacillus badius]MED0668394.1 LytTR family DNA-binding domain-containing protein [Bacillus badius]OCS86508.1 histidine kinase [Bacillus badius]OVE52029.1 histidine kinase [Bacillus badius]TDW03727.1 LytTR family transcriptional regulator [Bacillus badius]